MLFEALFELGNNHCKQSPYVQGAALTDIKKIIIAYVKV